MRDSTIQNNGHVFVRFYFNERKLSLSFSFNILILLNILFERKGFYF